jgi:hypothetical protein
LVSCGFAARAKALVYGNGRYCSTTARLAFPVPLSVPLIVRGEPNGSGLGTAAADSPSGCLRVLNVRSLPLTVPAAYWATIR